MNSYDKIKWKMLFQNKAKGLWKLLVEVMNLILQSILAWNFLMQSCELVWVEIEGCKFQIVFLMPFLCQIANLLS